MKNKTQPPKLAPTKMAKPAEIKYEDKPFGKNVKISEEEIEDFLPSPKELVRKESDQPVKNRYDYHDINSAPRNGSLIVVSETGKDKGEVAFWKKTRAFANATHKWEETGFFVSNTTNLKLSFKPKFWRARVAYEI